MIQQSFCQIYMGFPGLEELNVSGMKEAMTDEGNALTFALLFAQGKRALINNTLSFRLPQPKRLTNHYYA